MPIRDRVLRFLRREQDNLTLAGRRTFDILGINATGRTSAGLDSRARELGTDTLALTLFGSRHVEFAIFGRGPGGRPPLSELVIWAAAVGYTYDLFLLQQRIADEGTLRPDIDFVSELEDQFLPDFERRLTSVRQGEFFVQDLTDSLIATQNALRRGR